VRWPNLRTSIRTGRAGMLSLSRRERENKMSGPMSLLRIGSVTLGMSLCLWSALDSASTEPVTQDDFGLNSVDVVIQPGPRYLLSAQWSGTVLQAPELGRAYAPQGRLPKFAPAIEKLFADWDLNGDQTAVLVITYPETIFDQISYKEKRAAWLH